MANTAPPYRDATIDAPVVLSARSVALASPGRGDDLRVRISAPAEGRDLPIVLFSHGFGSSMDGYAPLTDYWAAHGFVVIQPTYLDARRMGLQPDDPRTPGIWRQRVADAKHVLDHLDEVAAALPGLDTRFRRDRLAAAGHSFGAQTTGMLLGATMAGTGDGAHEDMSDKRITAGILLAAGGKGGDDLSAFAKANTPYLDTDYATLTVPTLVVAGDEDRSPLTVRGPDWFTDPYFLSPGAEALVTLVGGEHMLGGISGYAVAETTDEDPARVAVVQRTTTAFLRHMLLGDDRPWQAEIAARAGDSDTKAHIETK